ncbi:hypothetical protein PoB_005698800 [Plakobranchus ocellatus]|uniref:Uncharacterized protein n=1 Tax=Plakobranchus ocellatus TaxID=259542 RepID=A0AAV4CG58_9GAST|nr:hypothetical protein PoB_005698800 [Plakobranchus ocellatus]
MHIRLGKPYTARDVNIEKNSDEDDIFVIHSTSHAVGVRPRFRLQPSDNKGGFYQSRNFRSRNSYFYFESLSVLCRAAISTSGICRFCAAQLFLLREFVGFVPHSYFYCGNLSVLCRTAISTAGICRLCAAQLFLLWEFVGSVPRSYFYCSKFVGKVVLNITFGVQSSKPEIITDKISSGSRISADNNIQYFTRGFALDGLFHLE